MIYLVKHLSKSHDIVVSSLSDLPENNTYSVANDSQLGYNSYLMGDRLFANIITTVTTVVNSDNEMHQIVSYLYSKNRDSILNKYKTKFIIAAVALKNDNSKEVIHASSYINLISDAIEYNKLPENGPMHHYEIYNYHSESFEIYIKKEDAIKKLISYIDRFISEHKQVIVKEFLTKEQFLEYITNNI